MLSEVIGAKLKQLASFKQSKKIQTPTDSSGLEFGFFFIDFFCLVPIPKFRDGITTRLEFGI
jgi:hypothetical protein